MTIYAQELAEEKLNRAVNHARSEANEWSRWGVKRTDPVQKLFAENQVNFWKKQLTILLTAKDEL